MTMLLPLRMRLVHSAHTLSRSWPGSMHLGRLTHRGLQERLTAKEAMAHPYFAPIRDKDTLALYVNGAQLSLN